MRDASYATGRAELSAGDFVFFYTDGITEAMNENNEEYSEERLAARLVASRSLPAEQIIGRVLAELQQFENSRGNRDDRTMVVLKWAAGQRTGLRRHDS